VVVATTRKTGTSAARTNIGLKLWKTALIIGVLKVRINGASNVVQRNARMADVQTTASRKNEMTVKKIHKPAVAKTVAVKHSAVGALNTRARALHPAERVAYWYGVPQRGQR